MPNYGKPAIIEGYLARENIVRNEIVKHGEIQETKLKNIIVPKHMAKNTFEKTLIQLQLKELADFRKEGKRKKIWYVESVNVAKFKELEKFIKDKEKNLPKLSKDFGEKSIEDKVEEVKMLFSIFETNTSFTEIMYILEKTPKKEYDKQMELMRRFLKINLSIWKKDKDSDQLISELMVSLMNSSPFFSKFIDALQGSKKYAEKT